MRLFNFGGKKAASIPQVSFKASGFEALSPYSVYRGLDGGVYLYKNLDPQALIDKYEQVAPLYTAITRLANATASLPIQLVDKDTQEADPTHPAYKLLCAPNKEMQRIKSELIRDMVIWKVLTGNTYLTLTGNPTAPPLELYLLNPRDITLKPAANNFIGEIVYQVDTNNQTTYKKDLRTGTYKSGLQEIYHISNFNGSRESSDMGGSSEIISLYYEINHYIHASEHNLSLLSNGGRPSGAFVLKTKDGSPANLTEEAFARLKSEINANYAGAANAGRMLVLEGGLEFQEMQMSPKDLDFSRLKDGSEEKIYQALGVPVQLIMSMKTTSNNMSNIRLEFYENRVLPLGDDIAAHLSNALLPRYGKDAANKYQFIVDRDNIDVLITSRAERRKSIETSLIMTVNEKRKEYKLPPIPGGDKVVDPNGRPIAGADALALIPPVGNENPTPPEN